MLVSKAFLLYLIINCWMVYGAVYNLMIQQYSWEVLVKDVFIAVFTGATVDV